MIGSAALAFLAGVLSILSPCVLPIAPIVVAAAAAQSRWGPVALAAGLALSFVAVGLFVATIGFSIGLDGQAFRSIAAILMVTIGIALMLPRLQNRLALAGGPFASWAGEQFGDVGAHGVAGQFLGGAVLGAVWSPCVGPTLGVASVLASQSRDLPEVALTMLAFGLGAGLPLAGFGMLSRQALQRHRARLLATGRSLKAALGFLMVLFGGLILSGTDKRLEAILVAVSPHWLTTLTTRF